MSTMKYIACIALTVCCFTLLASAQSRRDVKQIENTFNGFDKNKNGRVTQKEFLGFWESRFLATDKNEDGVLDQTEFLHAGNFQSRDVNKDGVIELDEDLTVRERHWKAYRMGNKNWLSLDDYMRFVRGLPLRSDYDRETTFTKMDSDQNGKLTEDEYLAFWNDYFTKRDANNDDRLNRLEHRHADSFNSFDANRNGSIERQEDALIRKKDFEGLDLDEDGALTQQEFVR